MPRTLLVEDNEMNRDMLSRRLARKGYDVSSSVDGAQDVAMAADESPDLILKHMRLPVMDGYDTKPIDLPRLLSKIEALLPSD